TLRPHRHRRWTLAADRLHRRGAGPPGAGPGSGAAAGRPGAASGSPATGAGPGLRVGPRPLELARASLGIRLGAGLLGGTGATGLRVGPGSLGTPAGGVFLGGGPLASSVSNTLRPAASSVVGAPQRMRHTPRRASSLRPGGARVSLTGTACL